MHVAPKRIKFNNFHIYSKMYLNIYSYIMQKECLKNYFLRWHSSFRLAKGQTVFEISIPLKITSEKFIVRYCTLERSTYLVDTQN